MIRTFMETLLTKDDKTSDLFVNPNSFLNILFVCLPPPYFIVDFFPNLSSFSFGDLVL